jgi:hypothetical protein
LILVPKSELLGLLAGIRKLPVKGVAFTRAWDRKIPATDEWLRTCTIITGEPKEFVHQIHYPDAGDTVGRAACCLAPGFLRTVWRARQHLWGTSTNTREASKADSPEHFRESRKRQKVYQLLYSFGTIRKTLFRRHLGN